MSTPLSAAELGHLRRLVAWIDCEIGQPPDEMVAMVRDKIIPAIGEISDEAKMRLVHAHEKSSAAPKYIREAIKALRKTVRRGDDAERTSRLQPIKRLPAP